jgi:secreted PhoX family phosphatase
VAGTRREFVGIGVGAVAAVGLGAAFWDDLFGSAGSKGDGRHAGYGPRRSADEHGLRLPEGFRARMVARGEQPVEGTEYRWHVLSDGMACFPAGDGGWILVSNSETLVGGASAIRFGADGAVASAYRILEGTSQNCSGGGTPWGTWLSCEEVATGLVWECDPAGTREAVSRPAMGTFKHEAAAVDPSGRTIYLTEDLIDGCIYRFTPARWEDLSDGLLEIASVDSDGAVRWSEIPDPAARRMPTRRQVRGSAPFKRAEGIWHDDGVVYLATTGDHRVHAYDTDRERIEVIYDGLGSGRTPLLRVDQLTANRAGEVFVCEDIATDEIDIGLIDRRGRVSKFLSATGPDHVGSELTGVTFDPSGSRMYFASQRAFGDGVLPGPGAIYEVSGPFRGSRAFHATGHSA